MKTLGDFFSGLREQKAAEAQTAEQVYTKLVQALANGEHPPMDETLPALGDAGRTVEDLQRDVERLLKRREWAATIKREPEIRRTLDELWKRKVDRIEKFKESEKQHIQALQLTINEMDVLRQELRRIDDAKAGLAGSADKSIAKRQTEIGRDQLPLQDELQSLRGQLESAVFRQGSTVDETVEAAKREAAEIRTKIAAVEKRIAAADAEIESLQERAFTA